VFLLYFAIFRIFSTLVIRRKNEILCFNEWWCGEWVSEVRKQCVGISAKFWVSICGFLVGFMALFNYFL
jgi:hypothetical protein